jgi:phosphopantetheine adenylyltransferase
MIKGVIDISIKSFKSVIKSKKDLQTFLSIYNIVETKYDGLKVYIYKYKNDGDVSDFLVSYKGNIIYPEELEYNTDEEAKKSIGASQFKFIFHHLKQVSNKIPEKMLFFCEYLAKKPTLASPIENHELILLAYTKTDCDVKNFRLVCKNTNFSYDRDERKYYANLLGILYPEEVFTGILYPTENFEKGINTDRLRKVYLEHKQELENSESDLELYWKILNNIFLETPGRFGETPEGYVFYNDKFPPLKIQQEYQLSREERQKLKQKYKDDPIKETRYWLKVNEIAEKIINKIKPYLKKYSYQKILGLISKEIKALPQDLITHTKKDWSIIKDDIALTVKLNLIKELAPKTGLIIGKFRVLTKKHYKLIAKALRENEKVIIALSVSRGKDKTFELRKKVIEHCFKNNLDKIEIISTATGYIPSILQKAFYGIGVKSVYAGSDRIENYQKQLEEAGLKMKVIELKRNDNISATNVIEHLDDKDYFEKMTSPCVWDFYEDYKKIYSN